MTFPASPTALPAWLRELLDGTTESFTGGEARMRWVVQLARRNVEEGSGGPFGAAVFERDSGRLVAVGVNLVIASSCSLAHAEMVAIAGAQQRLGTWDLGADGLPAHELVCSCEPCAMCFGALPWSGIVRVVCGATREDATAIGFDEGPRHPEWIAQLRERGIEVQTGVGREAASEVMQRYRDHGGQIYGARRHPGH